MDFIILILRDWRNETEVRIYKALILKTEQKDHLHSAFVYFCASTWCLKLLKPARGPKEAGWGSPHALRKVKQTRGDIFLQDVLS